MNSLKAKRIVAVAGGAALLGLGLAFAGPITFQNVPVINNAGAPVIQVVLGHAAKPSDGVAAASIAAAIGNLAYVSTPVTASINPAQAQSVLGATVPSSAVTLSNEQVWLNESASASLPSNVYGFTTLIGSVLNHAVQLNSPTNTKTLASGSTYGYPGTSSASGYNAINPMPSPYVAYGTPSIQSVTATYNGGGLSFTSFRKSGSDNLLKVGSAQLPSLMNNVGKNGETEYLWLAGFPVYNQHAKAFNLASASGAYQVVFNKPINQYTSSGSLNSPDITLLGQNWTILNYTTGFTATATGTTTTTAGGAINLAQSLTPTKTLYVGQNFSVDNFTIELADLGRANSNGISPAILNIYYKNSTTPTNTTTAYSPGVTKFNVSGHTLFVKVKDVVNGYTLQYAKIQAYSNVYKITNNQVYNQTNNPGWTAQLLWTNTSATTKTLAQLQSIILINSSAKTLTPGQSFSFVQDPSKYKLTFVGQTLGSANFDPITVKSQHVSSVMYQNTGTTPIGNTITNVTEPAEELVVTSSIPGAFTVGSAPQSSTLTYNLVPYKLDSALTTSTPGINVYADISSQAQNLVSSTHPLTITVNGYADTSHVSKSYTIASAPQLSSNTPNSLGSLTLSNITSIKLSRAIPGLNVYLSTNAVTSSNTFAVVSGTNSSASLTYVSGGQVLYAPATGKVYDQVTPATASATYNQHNGQLTSSFTLSSASGTFGTGSSNEYWTYKMSEIAVPSQALSLDYLSFGLFNNTGGAGAEPLFIVNGSVGGAKNNVTYTSTSGKVLKANQSFVTERGSKVASIAPYALTFDIAKAVDHLQFTVGPASASTSSAKSYTLWPKNPIAGYGIGTTTNIANVSIGKVTAAAAVTPGSFTVTGINNITATPSVTSATTPVLLKNLSAGSPSNLVVLDSQANSGSTLILIGSGYVNSLSQQLQQALNVQVTSTAPVLQAYAANTSRGARILVAGYTANQTTQEANAFIQDLYNAAATS